MAKFQKFHTEFSKLIVSIVILLNLLFTTAVLYIFYMSQSEPQALIAAFFAFTTGELILLSKIKRSEITQDKNMNVGENCNDK